MSMSMSLPLPLPTTTTANLILGQPVFADPEQAACASAHGAEAAWQLAWRAGAAQAASRVQGGFAVGLSDDSGRAFLAVDRFAAHTICYRVLQGRLHFSARADELISPAERALDPQALFDYLYFHAIPSPRTVFAGVQRLPPGHYAEFVDGKLTVAPYWRPRFQPQRRPDFKALAQEFRSLVRQAVARRLDGGKAACFLSGGTDSSTVAGMIGECAGRPAATYSIGFEADGYDEMAFARLAVKRFGTEHHEYYVTPADLVRSIPEVAAHYDQPFGNSSALPAYYCAKMAREDGVTRLLAGDGGDELFGGNSRYAKQRVFGWYGLLPGALQRGLMEPVFERSALGRLPLLKKGASYIEQAKVPMPDRLQMYNLLQRLGLAQVLSPALLARVDTGSPLAQQRAVWQQADAAEPIDRMLAFDWRYTLAESDLPKVRETTRMAGVEVAFPFLDDDLLAFSMQLPAHYKLKGLKLRWFFKEALRGFLPDEILSKRKQGFGLPFGVWATRDAALKALAVDSLRSLGSRGLIRSEFIRELIEQRLPEHPGYYGEMVWILMMLEQWLRHHAPDFKLLD